MDALKRMGDSAKVGINYGNWGGPSWSGGKRIKPGDIGPYNVKSIDQMDFYFREHDTSVFRAIHLGEPKGLQEYIMTRELKQQRRQERINADKQLYYNLKSLPADPKQWNPPANNLEESMSYRGKAEWWFGDILGYKDN